MRAVQGRLVATGVTAFVVVSYRYHNHLAQLPSTPVLIRRKEGRFYELVSAGDAGAVREAEQGVAIGSSFYCRFHD